MHPALLARSAAPPLHRQRLRLRGGAVLRLLPGPQASGRRSLPEHCRAPAYRATQAGKSLLHLEREGTRNCAGAATERTCWRMYFLEMKKIQGTEGSPWRSREGNSQYDGKLLN
ncbi:uncharacterized protein LOC144582208 isoform X1 [Callithrix jacchus]